MHWKIYHPDNEKYEKQNKTTERMKLPNQESVRKHGEKESYKYFGILEADIINQAYEIKITKNKKKKKLHETKVYTEII